MILKTNNATKFLVLFHHLAIAIVTIAIVTIAIANYYSYAILILLTHIAIS